MTPHHKPKNVKLTNNLRRSIKQRVGPGPRDINLEKGLLHESAFEASSRALARIMATEFAEAAE